jgi:UDPglucose--hexose-1-phosphate uridylyltransferase
VPNKYPAVAERNASAITKPVFEYQEGTGVHEVIIESVQHNVHFAYHETEQAEIILQTLRQRYQKQAANEQIKMICLFNNHGDSSGASLSHPHFQLIGLTMVPPRVEMKLKYWLSYYEKHGKCVFETMREKEVSSGERIAASSEHFIALCPFGSAIPFELYFLSRENSADFREISDEKLSDCAGILQQILRRLDEGLGRPDYNLVIHTVPVGREGNGGLCWYIQLCPRLSVKGGFEFATDIYINTVTPETAAAFYRGD